MKPHLPIRSLTFALLLACVAPAASAHDRGKDKDEARVAVTASHSSAFVLVDITSFRKIGKVLIEVKDAEGHVLYREEGRALTPELVRRLDKNVFPKGALTLSVTARDFRIAQRFTIE